MREDSLEGKCGTRGDLENYCGVRRCLEGKWRTRDGLVGKLVGRSSLVGKWEWQWWFILFINTIEEGASLKTKTAPG